MKEYVAVWDIAKQNDATVVQIYKRVPDFVGQEHNQRIFTFCDLIWQTKWEQVPYDVQINKICTLLNGVEFKNNHDLLLDGTGVGQAVVDFVRAGGLEPTEIVFSGGIEERPLYLEARDRRFGTGMDMKILRGYSVPKENLVAAAEVMLKQKRIRVAEGIPYEAEFKKQLLHFQGKVNEKGHVQYGNDAEAQHDDFVAAFLMMCWWIKREDKEKESDALEKPVNRASNTYDWNPLKNYRF